MSRDPYGNPPRNIVADAAAVTRSSHVGLSITPTIQSREPAGSIAGLIEEQVERQNQQLDAVIQEIRPHRPDPVIATDESIISAMTTQPSPSLPSLDMTLPSEWQGNLLPADVKRLHKIPIKYQDQIIS